LAAPVTSKRLGDEARVVDRGRERPGAVLGIAEDERDPRLGGLRAGGRDEREGEEEEGEAKGANCLSDRGFQRHCFLNERAAQPEQDSAPAVNEG
jgi:hypothetical protein